MRGPGEILPRLTADLRTAYWDWTARMDPLLYMKHCGTPPEHLMFGLRAALDMIFAESLEAVWRRHALTGIPKAHRLSLPIVAGWASPAEGPATASA